MPSAAAQIGSEVSFPFRSERRSCAHGGRMTFPSTRSRTWLVLAAALLLGCGDDSKAEPTDDATSTASAGSSTVGAGGSTGGAGSGGGIGEGGTATGGSGGEGGSTPKPPPRVLLIGPDTDLW